MTFRPLLASKADLSKINHPVYVSNKIDGIRCLVGANGVPISRNMNQIDFYHAQNWSVY